MAKIIITDELFIDIDEYNYVLKKNVVVTGDNARGKKAKKENIGKVREQTIGYYGSLKAVVEGIVRRELADLDSDEMSDIKKCIKRIERAMEHAANFDKKFVDLKKG